MTKEQINKLKFNVNHWYEWVVDEEFRLNQCTDEGAKPLLKNRLIGGYRYLNALEHEYSAHLNAYKAAMEDMKECDFDPDHIWHSHESELVTEN